MNVISYAYNLDQIRQRSPVAFTRLYREYKEKIFTFLTIKAYGNIQVAEEVICDTFHSAIESAPKLKNISNIQAWLLQIASRRLADYFRKQSKDMEFYNEYEDEAVLYDQGFPSSDDDFSNQKAAFINQAFNNLKDSYKSIISLKYIEKNSLKEISRCLNKKFSTVNSLLERARKALKKEFKKIIKKSN